MISARAFTRRLPSEFWVNKFESLQGKEDLILQLRDSLPVDR